MIIMADWARQISAWQHLQRYGDKEFIEDLLSGGSWQVCLFRRPSGTKWLLSSYRYDFGQDPNRFWKLMEEGGVTALMCNNKDGHPLMDKLPIASYRKEEGNGNHYYCLYVIDEIRP